MIKIKDQLFDAFRADHAVLGRGLFDLATRLKASDEAGVRSMALKVDKDAGPHIAFEEMDFYPTLSGFLTTQEIDEMYREHSEGCDLIKRLKKLPHGALSDHAIQEELLKEVESIATHVSECGELFGAMGGLTTEEQATLYQKLKNWRQRKILWTQLPVK